MQTRTGNAEWTAIQGNRLRQTPDTKLGRRIGRTPFSRSLSADRADIQNPSRLLLFHQTKRRPTAEKGSGQAGTDHVIPRVQRDLVEWASIKGPRVIDQNIHSPKLFLYGTEESFDVGLDRDITRLRQHIGSLRTQFVGNLLQRFAVPGTKRQRSPRGCKGECNRFPNPSIRPSDYRNLMGEFVHRRCFIKKVMMQGNRI